MNKTRTHMYLSTDFCDNPIFGSKQISPKDHKGVVTITTELLTEGGIEFIDFSVAFCSPKDEFSKNGGKAIASIKSIYRVQVTPYKNHSINKHTFNKRLLDVLIGILLFVDMPTWAEPIILAHIGRASYMARY